MQPGSPTRSRLERFTFLCSLIPCVSSGFWLVSQAMCPCGSPKLQLQTEGWGASRELSKLLAVGGHRGIQDWATPSSGSFIPNRHNSPRVFGSNITNWVPRIN